MTLRDLLLQFAGANERMLTAADLIEENINKLQFLSEDHSTISFLLTTSDDEKVTHEIDEVLNNAGYKEYFIRLNEDGEKTIITVEF